MINVYVNYPNSSFMIHSNIRCGYIDRDTVNTKRTIKLNLKSFSDEITNFINQEYKFASTSSLNDMWIEIDFGDNEFEMGIVKYVQKLLGKYYSPLRDCAIKEHC